MFTGIAAGIAGFLAAVSAFSTPHDIDWPLPDSASRPQLLTFGLHVTPDPEQNPIDPPERFAGYHAALDLEILPGEETTDVPVTAICPGEVIVASTADGYVGVIVHRCVLDGEEVTVLYGHVNPTTFTVHPGDQVGMGQRIASLAVHKSPASGDTRKHLHFGIHKGRDVEYRGYVQTEEELNAFIDPKEVLP